MFEREGPTRVLKKSKIPVATKPASCPNVTAVTAQLPKINSPTNLLFYRSDDRKSVRGTQIGSWNVRKLIPKAFVKWESLIAGYRGRREGNAEVSIIHAVFY